eukprot:TRINITY_DN3611_c2_g1_i1.p1 TRINITY_DN3611_c2_g1~~TRINITY_DN3611_c2_g1_i1.p1  ORF type:complete len:1672 (+),score=383.78 TRINITY_DN3611_c2_g1_i1:44-5017(+)
MSQKTVPDSEPPPDGDEKCWASPAWHPLKEGVMWVEGDEFATSALQQLVEENNSRKEIQDLSSLGPLELQTLRKAMVYLMLHHNEMEEMLVLLENSGKEMTEEEWDNVWKKVAEASQDEDSHAAERKYPMKSMFSFFKPAPLLTLDVSASETVSQISRQERDITMHRLYCLLNSTKSETQKYLPISDWLRLIDPNKKTTGGNAAYRNVRSQAAAELVTQQAKACSIEMSQAKLTEFFAHIMGERGEKVSLDQSAREFNQNVVRYNEKRWRKGAPIALGKILKPKPEQLAFWVSVGNFKKITFGLKESDELFELLDDDVQQANKDMTQELQDQLSHLKEDILLVTSSIMSEKAMVQFERRLRTYTTRLGIFGHYDMLREVCESYIIHEATFCNAYVKTFGIVPDSDPNNRSTCAAECDLWPTLAHIFNGEINKKIFLSNCAKKPTIPAEGLGYHIGYTKRRYEITMRDMFFVLYIIFVILLTFFLQSDKGIRPGYYLNVAINENIGKDEIGDETKYWFAQTFYDAVNEEEYWDWFKGPLLQSLYDSDEPTKPGTQTTFFHSSKLVGGMKLRQFRQRPRNCKGMDALFASDTDVCRAEGDTRKFTDWLSIKNKNVTTDPVTSTCLEPNAFYDDRDPVTIVIDTTEDYWEACNVIAHATRILIEEKLTTRATIANATDVPGISTTHITIGTGSGTVTSITQGWFMTQAGATACPKCTSIGHTALFNSRNAAVFNSIILDRDATQSDVEAKLISNNLTSFTRETHAISDYDTVVLSRNSNGDSLLFYDVSPGKLTGSFPTVRLTLADDYSQDTISKGFNLASTDLKEHFADIEQLVHYLVFNENDMKSMMKDLNNENATASACNWLKNSANTWKWYQWVRRAVADDMQQKRNSYHPKCYDSWEDRKQDERGYLDSQNLVTGVLPPNVNYTPKAIYNIDNSNALTDELMFYAPTREQFKTWIQQAEDGNLTAQALWFDAQPWVYRSCSELGGAKFLSYPGRMVASGTQTMALYGCSGYGTILPVDMSYQEMVRVVEHLNANQWIDVSTRGVMVEFFIHNQNSRLISRFQYMAEISTTGGYAMTLQVHTFRLFQLSAQQAPALFVIAVIITLLLMFTLIYESFRSFRLAWHNRLVELRAESDKAHGNWCPLVTCNKKCSFAGIKLTMPLMVLYFSDFWYVFDTIFFGVVVISWAFRFWFMWLSTTDANIACDRVFPDQYETASEISYSLFQLDGVAILLAYMRFIYYLRSFQEINRIVMTVTKAALLIVYLLVIFVIFMMAFTLSAWVVFGTLIERYRGAGDAFGTLLFMMMGEIDFDLMSEARPGFSLTFFLLFYIIVITILFNLLIGVITSSFNEVYTKRFDEDAFIARVVHDPASGAWDGDSAFGLRQFAMENAAVREALYYVKKMTYSLNCLREKKELDYRNSNPRKFWPSYQILIQDLDSPDMHLVFRAHTIFKLLAKKYGASLNPSASEEEGRNIKSYDLTAKPVMDFIDDSVGPTRRSLIDFMLVEVPSRIMNLNKTRAWHMLLSDHKIWKDEVERWANFDLMEDADDVNNHSQQLKKDILSLKDEISKLGTKLGLESIDGADVESKNDSETPHIGASTHEDEDEEDEETEEEEEDDEAVKPRRASLVEKAGDDNQEKPTEESKAPYGSEKGELEE